MDVNQNAISAIRSVLSKFKKKKKKQPVSEINRGTLANGIKYHVEDSHCYPLVSSQELNKE